MIRVDGREFGTVDGEHLQSNQYFVSHNGRNLREDFGDGPGRARDEVGDGRKLRLGIAGDRHELDVSYACVSDRARTHQSLRIDRFEKERRRMRG